MTGMMASAASVPRWLGNAAAAVAKGVAWFLPVFITAVMTAWLSYKYNQKSNVELIAQQQRISDLQQFRASGSQLDQGLSGLSDALVDGKGLDQARREMRQAITRNLSDALAARHILGPSTDRYIAGLADLRTVVDRVDGIDSGQELWQKSLNLMKLRRTMISNAESPHSAQRESATNL